MEEGSEDGGFSLLHMSLFFSKMKGHLNIIQDERGMEDKDGDWREKKLMGMDAERGNYINGV